MMISLDRPADEDEKMVIFHWPIVRRFFSLLLIFSLLFRLNRSYM